MICVVKAQQSRPRRQVRLYILSLIQLSQIIRQTITHPAQLPTTPAAARRSWRRLTLQLQPVRPLQCNALHMQSRHAAQVGSCTVQCRTRMLSSSMATRPIYAQTAAEQQWTGLAQPAGLTLPDEELRGFAGSVLRPQGKPAGWPWLAASL